MTDQPKPSSEALAAADAFFAGRGWLRGGVMATQLAEAFDAFALEELERCSKLLCLECAQASPVHLQELQHGTWWVHGDLNITCRANALRPKPVASMLGQPITDEERRRISEDGP